MVRTPIPCPENEEPCVRPACSLTHCVAAIAASEADGRRRLDARDRRRRALQKKPLADITLDDLLDPALEL